MAEVWLGRRVGGQLAAIKILRDSADAETRALFARESRVLRRLRHPNLVPLFDVGENFLVSAYVEGADLQRRMRSPMSPVMCVDIVCQVASALQAVHDAGVVHCDVKPANILIDASETPLLTDFGVAHLLDDAEHESSQLVRGTPSYMAPEHRQGAPLPASDQYALAKTLLVLLGGITGLPPIAAIAALPSDYDPLKPVLKTALEDSPTKRYPHIRDFAAALRAVPIADSTTPRPRARLLRSVAPFGWVRGWHRKEQFSEHIARYDYLLTDLIDAGLVPEDVASEFLALTGCEEFGWSMYGRDERLGPLDRPEALARAKQSTALLHGLFTDRNLWTDVAVGLARNNADAVSLTPDLPGFGVSRLGKTVPKNALSPRGLVLAMNMWLSMLGLGETATAIVGHSYSAAALMCARESELGQGVHTVCITPTFMIFSWQLRMRARLDAARCAFAGVLPKALRNRVIHWSFRNEDSLARVSDSTCATMAESALQLGSSRVAKLFWAVAGARPAPPEELASCTVVTTPDDPMVTTDLAEQSISESGIPSSQWFRLVHGGHFPHLVDKADASQNTRNIHEVISLLDNILDKARKSQLRSASSKSSEKSNSHDSSALRNSSGELADEAGAEAATVALE